MAISSLSSLYRTVRGLLAVLALFVSSAAMAQADEPWEGTFDTNYGPVRLIQDGDRVYGDYFNEYQNDPSYIEGRVSSDGRVLRATWQKTGNRADNGFIEFALTGDGFVGDWRYTHNAQSPEWKDARWTGIRTSSATPRLQIAVGREHYYNDDFFRTVARLRSWAFFGQRVDVANTDLWGRTTPMPRQVQRNQLPTRPSLDVEDRPSGTVRPIERPQQQFPGEMHEPNDGDDRSFPGEMHEPADGDSRAFPGEMHEPSARGTSGGADTRQLGASSTLGSNALAHIPAFANWEGDIPPRFVDFFLTNVLVYNDDESAFKAYSLIGTIEMRVTCRLANGRTIVMPTTTGADPFVMNRTSTGQWNLRPTRRFTLDQRCLTDADSEITLSLATNLDQDSSGRRDDVDYGRHTYSVSLSQMHRVLEPYGQDARSLPNYPSDAWDARRFETRVSRGDWEIAFFGGFAFLE